MSLVPVPGAQFLGATVPLASAAAATPTLVIGPGWGQLFIYHYIAGYSSGGGIAIIQCGTATTVDTGTNYSSFTNHFTTAAAAGTSRVSQVGLQVANDSSTNGRRGFHQVFNPSNAPSVMDGRTVTFSVQTPAAASAAMATTSLVVGTWWNNAQAQCVAMSGGGVNLLTGSFISVYGIPGTG